MMSRTGTEDSREADPSDIEIEEGIGLVVEAVMDTPGGETRGSQWCDDEEEEATFEADPEVQDTSQGQGETGRSPILPQQRERRRRVWRRPMMMMTMSRAHKKNGRQPNTWCSRTSHKKHWGSRLRIKF